MKKTIFYILALVIFVSSCTEPIELELNSDDNVRLVVDAFITTDTKAHLVDLSLTKDYFEDGIPAKAENAIVTISNGSNEVILTELEPGKYYTPESYAGIENENYTLNIEYEGQNYIGSTVLLQVTSLDSIRIEDYEPEVMPGQEEEVEFPDNYVVIPFIQEPPSEGDHYLFKLLINGEYETSQLTDWLYTNDDVVNGNYIADVDFFSFHAEPGDSITFEMFSITKEDYQFIDAILLETAYRGGLFDGAPANVPSNIGGGAVGQFIMSDVERMTEVVE